MSGQVPPTLPCHRVQQKLYSVIPSAAEALLCHPERSRNSTLSSRAQHERPKDGHAKSRDLLSPGASPLPTIPLALPPAESDLAFLRTLLNIHVFEFARLKDLAALFTFDELRIFVSAHYLHAWMLARLLDITALRRGRLRRHKSAGSPTSKVAGRVSPRISRYFRPALPVVKPVR